MQLPRKAIDLTGHVFDRLTVVSLAALKPRADGALMPFWNCRCACGHHKAVPTCSLRSGGVRSCGCLQREVAAASKFVHGMSRCQHYKIHHAMIDRCHNPRHRAFKNYGGRGIVVCERWRGENGLCNFIEDMGDVPPGYTIERKNNSLGYSPDNCIWATRKQQNRNMRITRLISHDGKTQCLTDWANESKMSVGMLWWRLKRGWDFARAITTPARSVQS